MDEDSKTAPTSATLNECQACGGWGKPSTQMMADYQAHVARRGPQPEMADLIRPCGDCRGTGLARPNEEPQP